MLIQFTGMSLILIDLIVRHGLISNRWYRFDAGIIVSICASLGIFFVLDRIYKRAARVSLR